MTKEDTPKNGMLQAIRVFENGMTYEDIQKSPFSMVEQAIRFGAAWQKEKEQQRLHSDENLQALAGRYAYEEWDEDLVEVARDSFIDGYNICKQQMMKDAVEAVVQTNSMSGNTAVVHLDCKYKAGDKVRVIIIKDE